MDHMENNEMGPADIEALRQKLAAVNKQVRELKDVAGDFPAFDKNITRIQASLNMMNLALGGSVIDEP